MSVAVNFTFDRETRSAKSRGWFRSEDADGDSLHIEQPVRLVSVDTPEKAAYAGKPAKSQPKLDRTRERLQNGFFDALPDGLRNYLLERLTPDAAEKHIAASLEATAELDRLFEARLRRDDGTLRRLAVIPTGQLIDDYGRLLAYLAPWFTETEMASLTRESPERRTFNLDMVASGWGAPFPIYPSLPNNDDLELFFDAAETAWKEKRGVWRRYGRRFLLAYEYRACIKLSEEAAAPEDQALSDKDYAAKLIRKAFVRHCVDVRTLKDKGAFGFYKVDPPYRLWFWPEDEGDARHDLGLK